MPTKATKSQTKGAMGASKKEPEPSEKEEQIIRALLYDSLLGSQPLIAMNVRASLQILLAHLGRPRLATLVEKL